MESQKYRNDITFLRAVSVIAVVVFHIFPKWLKGGFLGVDVFFVISGYLITYILLKQSTKTNKINLFSFYKKRILRILPALLVLLLITSMLAYYILGFDALLSYAKAVKMSILGFANVYFWKHLDTSYFAAEVSTTLLLHIWSLGVEWQFYLLFPFLIIIIKPKYLLHTFIVLFLASVIASSIIVCKHQMFAYYMLPTRAFALLAGSIVAYLTSNNIKIKTSPSVINIVSVLCLLIIMLSFIFLNEDLKLPNYYTLLAVIPAGILIYLGANNSSLVAKIFANKIFVKIGLWSYSIYLYHWVIVAFWHIFHANSIIPLGTGVAIFVIAIILGALSYYLVEQPCLKLKWNFLFCLIFFMLIPFATSVWFKHLVKHSIDGYKQFLPKGYFQFSYTAYSSGTAFLPNNYYKDIHIINKKRGEPNILLWGDSYAGHIILALNEISKNIDVSFRNVMNSMCVPLIAVANEDSISLFSEIKKNVATCLYNAHKFLELSKNYDVVILSSRWTIPYYANHITDDEYWKALNNLIIELKKHNKIVIFIGGIPIVDQLNTTVIIQNKKYFPGGNVNLNTDHNKIVFHANELIENAVKQYENVYYMDFNDLLCPNGKCVFKEGKNSFYFNESHLSQYGSAWLGRRYVEKGIDKFWYKVKDLYKDRIDIKVNPDGSITNLKNKR